MKRFNTIEELILEAYLLTVPVKKVKEIPGGYDGMFYPDKWLIEIREGLEKNWEYAVLIHEKLHALLSKLYNRHELEPVEPFISKMGELLELVPKINILIANKYYEFLLKLGVPKKYFDYFKLTTNPIELEDLFLTAIMIYVYVKKRALYKVDLLIPLKKLLNEFVKIAFSSQ